ncbi:hypothetical protein [Streptomyces europaeiscabiei]|uniref:hypothetical protein n=1 Tax=Streptomyces europaeiscabiei TaxID=146819 RepID=UPI000765FB01|nr:hypothetical protein [Streptomyces europaeiscabiei]MDX3831368.1 hypothetical protein [Streptomyces europaeiscabiei]
MTTTIPTPPTVCGACNHDRDAHDTRAAHCTTCADACAYRPPRLLVCGLCYEELGEEVHPHPDCPLGHLETVSDRWSTLEERAGTRPTTSWPPAMGITRLMSDEERQELAEERADTNPDAPGPRPAPVDVDVLDVMTTVETGLVTAADWLASRIQREPVKAPTGKGWGDEAHRAAVLLAAKDTADPARWRFTGQRTATAAAEWLAARLADRPGPFRRLDDGERGAVVEVARMASELVRRSLGDARRVEPVPHPCPHPCGGQLVVEGGDGEAPIVRCTERHCGRTWTETVAEPG